MKRLLAVALVSSFAMVASAGSREGLAPRSAPSDYAVQKQAGNLSLGAARLPKEQVKNSFSSDLDRGYIVVEVGVFPGESGVELRRNDFMLRAADKNGADLVRPAAPETVAGVLQKKNRQAGRHDVDVYPHGDVGYSTGTRDAYGNRYPGGWTTGVGVGVGVGNNNPAPASTNADRRTMETELRDKVLPEGSQTSPVAGYLYFPVATKDKISYQLEYKAADGAKLVLPLPDSKK
jgi:hypothetical protein